MPKRRRRLVVLVAAAALFGTLALPAVHWRLIGWARGEPFYQGRPESYWAADLTACEVQVVAPMCGMFVHNTPRDTAFVVLYRRPGVTDRLRRWFADVLNRPELIPDPKVRSFIDEPAVTVLTTLLDCPAPAVRFYAAQSLGSLEGSAHPALPALRRLVADQSQVVEDVIVAQAVARALYRIDPAAWEAAGRPCRSPE